MWLQIMVTEGPANGCCRETRLPLWTLTPSILLGDITLSLIRFTVAGKNWAPCCTSNLVMAMKPCDFFHWAAKVKFRSAKAHTSRMMSFEHKRAKLRLFWNSRVILSLAHSSHSIEQNAEQLTGNRGTSLLVSAEYTLKASTVPSSAIPVIQGQRSTPA